MRQLRQYSRSAARMQIVGHTLCGSTLGLLLWRTLIELERIGPRSSFTRGGVSDAQYSLRAGPSATRSLGRFRYVILRRHAICLVQALAFDSKREKKIIKEGSERWRNTEIATAIASYYQSAAADRLQRRRNSGPALPHAGLLYKVGSVRFRSSVSFHQCKFRWAMPWCFAPHTDVG